MAEKPWGFAAILRAGILCGILDISAAFVTWGIKGVKPIRILQGIASGLLGAKSFQGGWETATLGGAFHFMIALSAATVFYAASRKLKLLTRRPILSGMLYGIVVYLVMYWLVIPLSDLGRGPFSISATVVAILTHMVCVGLPISLVVRRYST